MAHVPQVVSFTAPTGSGKTIIMAALIEDIFFGTEKFEEQPEAIFVWLSDSPQLNEQSKQKIDLKADKIRLDQCVTIDDDSFDRELLEDGHIYFLNTQKIGKSGNLTKHSDTRQYTIWETLENTLREKSDRLYFIIDEAHRGTQGREAGRATSIMQKFLKGSPVDKLSPMPIVFGMSATTARFNRLVEGIKTTTVHKVEVTAAEVRASGLLKDRIIITYPEDYTAHNDMAILQAATDEWKDKCVHWYQYSYEQHYAQVHPIFVIQVKNGSGNKISDTNLDDCLAKIEERINYRFAESEVVHTFGQTGTITVNGLNVPHIEASDITGDKKIKIVFFKENLSTGWDCPRAETMMSFRRAEDATWIAQLLGRMVRTPLQNRVLVDESLNDVHLYLPYFDKSTVKEVIDSLQEAEGGDIPTFLEGESYENPNYTTWTIRPSRHPSTKVPVPTEDQISLFGEPIDPFHLPKAEGTEESEKLPEYIPHSDTDCVATEPEAISSAAQFVSHSEITNNETANTAAKQLSMTGVSINRDEIVKFINDAGLLTYEVKPIKIYSYLTSMLKLARLLSQADISSDALKQIQKDLVDMIHSYVEDLKSSGKYDEYAGQVLQFKLATQIFDVFGETVDNYAIHSLFTTTDTDLDRQLRNADIRLGNFGISYEYGRKYYDDDNPNGFKIDVILFAADDDCIAKLMLGLDCYAKSVGKEADDLTDEEIHIVVEKVAGVIDETLIKTVMQGQQVPAIFGVSKKIPQHEDFTERLNQDKINFYNKWTHAKTKLGAPLLFSELSEDETTDIEGAKMFFANDPEEEQRYIFLRDEFAKTLNSTDKEIYYLSEKGITQKEIAKRLGYKTHSAVSKRVKIMNKNFKEFLGFEN